MEEKHIEERSYNTVWKYGEKHIEEKSSPWIYMNTYRSSGLQRKDQNIVWFQVSIYNPVFMEKCQTISDLNKEKRWKKI